MAKLDGLLRHMVDASASDLHLSAGEPARMRVHGDLQAFEEGPLDAAQVGEIMREICTEEQWARYRTDKELDFSYGITGVGRFRCNYLEHYRGPGAVFRVIPEEIIPLEKLSLPEAIGRFVEISSGLVLVTGPTGSGKSTTLAAIIDAINRKFSRHIITLEDPIEFVHANKKSYIVQREVGQHTSDFARALHDALREDPDVILVGEMRDLETIALAVGAAEMGVLVFGTLHTNSAPKTIDRLTDVFPAAQQELIRNMLADSLVGIAAQQLLRRKDGSGRIAACEILLKGPGLPPILREGSVSKIYSYILANRAQGMQTIDDALMTMVGDGVVSPEDASLKAVFKDKFEQWVQERGFGSTL
jgi:twitching motility protein PilT